jgi:hypothetical protein
MTGLKDSADKALCGLNPMIVTEWADGYIKELETYLCHGMPLSRVQEYADLGEIDCKVIIETLNFLKGEE